MLFSRHIIGVIAVVQMAAICVALACRAIRNAMKDDASTINRLRSDIDW